MNGNKGFSSNNRATLNFYWMFSVGQPDALYVWVHFVLMLDTEFACVWPSFSSGAYIKS